MLAYTMILLKYNSKTISNTPNMSKYKQDNDARKLEIKNLRKRICFFSSDCLEPYLLFFTNDSFNSIFGFNCLSGKQGLAYHFELVMSVIFLLPEPEAFKHELNRIWIITARSCWGPLKCCQSKYTCNVMLVNKNGWKGL